MTHPNHPSINLYIYPWEFYCLVQNKEETISVLLNRQKQSNEDAPLESRRSQIPTDSAGQRHIACNFAGPPTGKSTHNIHPWIFWRAGCEAAAKWLPSLRACPKLACSVAKTRFLNKYLTRCAPPTLTQEPVKVSPESSTKDTWHQ